jgi:hypothetical protein
MGRRGEWMLLCLCACASGGTPDRAATQPTPAETANEADALAARVAKKFGDPYSVPAIQFGFEVQIEGEIALSRAHIWCPAEGIASVTTKDGKTIVVDVSIVPDDPDEARAHSSFINDSYWLLAPTKLLDPGVRRELTEDGELHVWFDEGVGLTPGDHYWFTVEDDRVTEFRYELESGRSGRFTWEGYGRFGPLMMATTHIREDGAIIRHPDVAIIVECPLD